MLRELAGVEQHEFINKLCGEQALRLLSPPGHSDAMFFLSSDERFLVRTISCAEKRVLLSVLQRYAEHLRRCAFLCVRVWVGVGVVCVCVLLCGWVGEGGPVGSCWVSPARMQARSAASIEALQPVNISTQPALQAPVRTASSTQ